jgi:ABC-type transporter Mla subunit MlaD
MSNFEDWTRRLGEFLEDTVRTTETVAEQTLSGFVEAADSVADEVEKQLRPTLEQWADDLSQSLEPLETLLDHEAERVSDELNAFISPIVMPLADALETWVEALAAPINRHVDPMINDHTVCIGCKHYYGQAHGGNMLVCGMHPYGPDDEQCPDWESVWGQPPSNE